MDLGKIVIPSSASLVEKQVSSDFVLWDILDSQKNSVLGEQVAPQAYETDFILEGVRRVTIVEVKQYGWHKEINLQGKIVRLTDDSVLCDCLLDPDNSIFEVRNFPKLLFENITDLYKLPYVYITIRTRPGTTRIDVRDGSKIVNKSFFEQKQIWDNPNLTKINTPLKKTIRYNAKG